MLTVVQAGVDAIVATHITAEDLASLESDGYRYDLLEGDLIRISPPGFRNGRLAAEITRRLGTFLVEHPHLGVVVGAETGFRLNRDPDTVLGPDAAVVRTDRLPAAQLQVGFLELAPDLVVEIVSPTDRWATVIGTAQVGKAPTLVADLKKMLDWLPGTRVGLRDRALLLVGFAGAFRRSELVSLDTADLEFSSAGLVVTLRRSKTDQEGKSRRLGIPFGSSEGTCPVRALQAWLETARIVDGPVFRPLDRCQRVQPTRLSAERVALIVKRRAKAIGLDPARYAGHSLRAGLAISAAAAGASERVIMSQTGHRSADMVRKYIREGSLFRENAASLAGL